MKYSYMLHVITAIRYINNYVLFTLSCILLYFIRVHISLCVYFAVIFLQIFILNTYNIISFLHYRIYLKVQYIIFC